MQDNKLIKALVLNAQLGNNSAFEQLYQMTIDQIYILMLRLTGNPQTAEIMTKKSYTNAWQRIAEKDEFTSFSSWLKKVSVETYLKEKSDEPVSGSNDIDAFFSHYPLEKHILELDLNNKLVFILHDHENFSIEEISKISSIPKKEIKDILVNTREHLIKLIEE